MLAPSKSGHAVGPQYSSTHVYLRPGDLDAFARSVIATLGGVVGDSYTGQVTPTVSQSIFKPISTPAGNIATFAFTTPIPYPFGMERAGCLVADMGRALTSAQAQGADLVVSAFPDAIGRDAIIQWPGGVYMQLYCHRLVPDYPALKTVPESRIYLAARAADLFVRSFVGWSEGRVIADDNAAPGAEIGRPAITFRRIRISSGFGNIVVFVTDGALPHPFGWELTGFEVPDLFVALRNGAAAGIQTLVAPFHSQDRTAAVVQFPGGFIAELHTATSPNTESTLTPSSSSKGAAP